MKRAVPPILSTPAERARFEAIQKNFDKLNECKAHSFIVPPLLQLRPDARLKCRNCGGTLEVIAINFYTRGFAAAGGNPNDVFPGWSDELREEPASDGVSERVEAEGGGGGDSNGSA